MENLTLTSEQLNGLKKAFAVVFAVVAAGTAFVHIHFFGANLSLANVIRWGSVALTLASLLFVVFYKWAWRLWSIPEWTGRPLIHGVWLGHLSSDYGRAPAEAPLKKPIVFVVRQTYLTLSLQSFTDNQVGESKVEALILGTCALRQRAWPMSSSLRINTPVRASW